jgi:DNA-binding CsgD family transcriptional regulator
MQPTGLVADLLSPQEFRIAMLAAQGMSNKDIAAQMYLSPRTVSSHLYRIFPKLGISSRSQLAAQLDITTSREASTPGSARPR